MQQKTFRLFISSTFSDFTEERKELQTVVFPEIKSYCSSLKKGYEFQPIDLRWGVSDEAQLDQKTLELCINEVRSSKKQPHPNFLILAGDRYGWVPCPYAIEQNEFELILSHVIDEDKKEILRKWYALDNNQIPPSYILQKRENEYTDYSTWFGDETELRGILQDAVVKCDFPVDISEKYFVSATEQEGFNGILKYKDAVNQFQSELINEDRSYQDVDFENVYGYIRNVKTVNGEVPQPNSEFFDEDTVATRVDGLKASLRDSINPNNLIDIDVDISDVSRAENGSLLYQYDYIDPSQSDMSEFSRRMIDFLKQSIDSFDKREQAKEKTENELLTQQSLFRLEKASSFIGREYELNEVHKYIEKEEGDKVLIVHGPSGIGKSAFMAQLITDQLNSEFSDKKVIYRFVGSNQNLSSSINVVKSIINELNLDVSISNEDTIQTLFLKTAHELSLLDDEVVIFIDAADQFTNKQELNDKTEFFWIPIDLPSNLKIVVSLLDDDDYSKDSSYLSLLRDYSGTDNNISLLPLNRKDSLLITDGLLGKYRRRITEEQKQYLLDRGDCDKPLYLKIAAEILRHWPSGVVPGSSRRYYLEDSQKGIIAQYIESLHEGFHHDPEMVYRVLGYLYLTNGLSESEILEIFSMDQEFIERMAPDTYHTNFTGELPVSIWARLRSHLDSFIKSDNEDGKVLLSFFHREFNTVIGTHYVSERLSNDLFEFVTALMKAYQYEPLSENRYTKVYVQLFTQLYAEDQSKLTEVIKDLRLINPDLLEELSEWVVNEYVDVSPPIAVSIVFYNVLVFAHNESQSMMRNLKTLVFTLYHFFRSQGDYEHSVKYVNKYVNLVVALTESDVSRWLCFYLDLQVHIAYLLNNSGDLVNSSNYASTAVLLYEEFDPQIIDLEFKCGWMYAKALVLIEDNKVQLNIDDHAGYLDYEELETKISTVISLSQNLYKGRVDTGLYVSVLRSVVNIYVKVVKNFGIIDFDKVLNYARETVAIAEELVAKNSSEFGYQLESSKLGLAQILQCHHHFFSGEGTCKDIDSTTVEYVQESIDIFQSLLSDMDYNKIDQSDIKKKWIYLDGLITNYINTCQFELIGRAMFSLKVLANEADGSHLTQHMVDDIIDTITYLEQKASVRSSH